MNRWARLLIAAVAVVALLLSSSSRAQSAASTPARLQNGPGATYTVRPGDTLQAIAARAGVPVRTLMRLNSLRHPRELYPGQVLNLGPSATWGWTPQTVTLGQDFVTLSRAAGVELTTAATANRLLLPTQLPIGTEVRLPQGLEARAINLPSDRAAPWLVAPRMAGAVRSGSRLWDVIWLNPQPTVRAHPLLVPATATDRDRVALPAPLVEVTLAPQPVARGETAVVTLRATEPVTCTLHYLDQVEGCHTAPGTAHHRYGLVGLPTMIESGRYTVTLQVQTAPPTSPLSIPLPLLVGKGRYDYERFAPPAGGNAQSDPARSQVEREKLWALRQRRSPVRYWDYPFSAPLAGSVTSYFGSRRSYGYGFSSFHGGTDFRAEVGVPVAAPAAGEVVLAEPLLVQGDAVVVDHGWGVLTGYWHLSRIDVTVGQKVARGETIGAVGNTGFSTGPHLHWQLWVNGVSVNPLSWLRSEGPVSQLPPQP